jgi:hypothetical protein
MEKILIFPEGDITDVETCWGSNINLKLHQELVMIKKQRFGLQR